MIRFFLAIALSIFCMSCEVKPKSKPQPNVTLTWERIKNEYRKSDKRKIPTFFTYAEEEKTTWIE